MSVDPFAHYDAAYVLGALDAADRSAYEAHLMTCPGCRADVAEARAVLPLLAGLDESLFAGPDETVTPSEPVPDTLLPGLLRAAQKERTRRRTVTGALGLIAAACVAALIVVLLPSGRHPAPAARAMTPLIASPVSATVALQPTEWGTEVRLVCWYNRPATAAQGESYELVAYGPDGAGHRLGSWRLVPGDKITYSSGVALPQGKITRVAVEEADGTAILALTP
jgi:hypothetical protein